MATTERDSAIAFSVTRWGAEAARPASPDDFVGGVPSRLVLEPDTEAMLSEMLRWAHAERLALVPRGRGTRLARGRPPARVDALLSLRRLTTAVDHHPGDLVATVPAGATLDGVNTVLRRERQWLPLDPPANGTSIGGLIGTNDSGPRRVAHGTPRDLILGVHMMLADGRQAKAGGQVVKNVTGYDLSRLLCGSEGRLAVVTAATFKLTPQAPVSRTVVAAATTPDDLGRMAAAIASAPLSPTCVEVESPAGRLVVRFEATERSAKHQAEAAAGLLTNLGAITDICDGGAEDELWKEHDAKIWGSEGLVMKLAVLPVHLGSLLSRLRTIAAQQRLDHAVIGRATLGVLLVRWPTPTSGGGRTVEMLRQEANAAGGTATLLSFPQPLGIRTDLWDDSSNSLRVVQAVKARLDPNNILSPGRGPGGS